MGDTKRVQIIQKRLDDAVRGTGNTPKALQYLKELDKIEMTVDILQATGIGKSVNRLRRLDMDIGQAAKALLKKWHHIVKASASSSQKKSNDNKAELTKAKLIKKESGRSSSRKRNAPAPVDIPSTSYHPMASASAPPPAPHPPPPPPPVKSKHSSIYWLFSDACTSRAFYLATVPDTDFAMAISKRGRSAVYSGRKTQVTTVQSLFQLSMKVIMDNIDALHEVGGTPYFILEPVLQRCTAVQLYHLEDCNSHLLDDTDGLWKTHCQRDFKKSAPAENQSWRELYLEKFEEREEKFKTLTARISRKKMEMEKEMEGKQVKLAKATVMRRSYYSSSSSSFSSRSGRHSPLKGPSQPTGKATAPIQIVSANLLLYTLARRTTANG
eukprot:m.49154 g.49154  ORF g.49154 m.49154 type:complete len:383 (+) comp33958_c0_seq16:69-1217(+)